MPVRAHTGGETPVQMNKLQATEGKKCRGFVKDRGVILPSPLAWSAWEIEVVGVGQWHRKWGSSTGSVGGDRVGKSTHVKEPIGAFGSKRFRWDGLGTDWNAYPTPVY